MRLSNLIRPARKIRENGGPTILPIGAINDGEFLKRVGPDIVSAAAGGGGGALEYMSSIVVAGSPVPSVSFDPVDGDADYQYEIRGLFLPTTNAWLCMDFNSSVLPSAGGEHVVYGIGGFLGLFGAAAASILYLAYLSVYNDDTDSSYFSTEIFAARGRGKPGKESQGYASYSGSSEGNGDTQTWARGTFRFQGANIVKINLFPTGGNLDVGSEFHLYRRKVS